MRGMLRFVCFATFAVLSSCDLEEVTIIEIEDVVIAEIYVNLAEDQTENEIRAFLHHTLGAPGVDDLSNALIVVRRPDGLTLNLVESQLEACLDSLPTVGSGACFLADPAQTPNLSAGDLLEVEVTLADGGVIVGAVRVPSSFHIDGVSTTCRLDPNTLLPILWSSSDGAWAYVSETSISGLPEALLGEGIVAPEDPLNLLGLSISDQDTTVVFPSEFGIFDRFDLSQDLASRLQHGLPPSTTAEVSITAVDRNFVNWVRGGNFNPSGRVRVPSLRGDGVGVFGATVSRRFFVFSSAQAGSMPDCPTRDGLLVSASANFS
ncbi:MAG TPA: hypothetical protein DIU18_03175 [Gemmatimonadetes bacterium]|nr:hypothetical protein [Gemmatimonadota bacterium]